MEGPSDIVDKQLEETHTCNKVDSAQKETSEIRTTDTCVDISEDASITSGIEKSDSENTLRSENSERQINESVDEFNIKSKTDIQYLTQLRGDLLHNTTDQGQRSRISESSSDGMLSESPSVEQRSRLTSAEDTDGTIKPEKQMESDSSSDSKSIETLDYTSSEDKSIETIDSEEDKCKAAAMNSDIPNRPESLFLQKAIHYEKRRSKSDEHKKIDTRTMSSSTAVDIPVRRGSEFENIEETMLSKSMPHGTVMKKGDMIEFVVDDLQEMIKRSSPMTHTESSATSSRRSSLKSYSSVSSSTSSAMGGMSRSPSSLFQQSPDDIPPIDPQAINDLEMHALKVADSLDLLMGNLKSNLHKMSAITVGCLSAYKTSVDTTCDSVDSSIKSMYALMAKCEELNNSMTPVNKLAEQIKEIKRLLDIFESQIADKTKHQI